MADKKKMARKGIGTTGLDPDELLGGTKSVGKKVQAGGHGRAARGRPLLAGTTTAGSQYTPGSDDAGGSGDLDLPDVSGRGTTSSILRQARGQRQLDEAKKKARGGK